MSARRIALALVAGAVVGGCNSTSNPDQDLFGGLRAAERSVGEPRTVESPATTVPLVVEGRGIPWDQLRSLLIEASGGEIIEEIVLDTKVERELEARGYSLTEDDLVRERRAVVETLARESNVDEQDAARLLSSLREARGLGTHRYDAMVMRSAGLRRLVADEVEITETMVETAFRLRHGLLYRIRIIVTDNERNASAARRRIFEAGSDSNIDEAAHSNAAAPVDDISSGPDAIAVRFATVASEISRDGSANRGGRIEPFSPADSRYPPVFGRALGTMQVGQVSPIIALERGFALLLLEERIEPDGTRIDDVRQLLTEEVRRRQERLHMDRLAARLLEDADVLIHDRDLRKAWDDRTR